MRNFSKRLLLYKHTIRYNEMDSKKKGEQDEVYQQKRKA